MPLSSALIETHELSTWNPAEYRVLETGQTRQFFDEGHTAGSVFWPMSELFTPDFRLQTDPARFADLMSRSGISPDTAVVCSHNGERDMAAWAPWLFWILTSFGHSRTFVLNGGTAKWRAECRPLTPLDEKPHATNYPHPAPFDETSRAALAQVRQALERSATFPDATFPDATFPDATFSDATALLDARTGAEFRGEHFFDAPPKPPERAGHIPGAQHLPHSALLAADGTYRSVEELCSLVQALVQALVQEFGLNRDRPAITYCAVGIRSSVLWFALKHLLDFPHVRNYDGSWNEWSRTETR